MKTFLAITLSLLALPALADITLGGPGVPSGQLKAPQSPFKVTYEFPGGLYKFVFRGIEAKGATLGAPGSSGTQGNGGQFHLSATVRTDVGQEKFGKIEFWDVQDFNVAPLKTLIMEGGDVVFKAPGMYPINVSIEWAGQGNAHKPDGFFNVLGEQQKAPPVPVGWLTFDVGEYNLNAAGGRPPGKATIIRD
jgi:hypothetical protein